MFVNRRDWDALTKRADTAEAKNAGLERHNVALEASLDWMRLRLSQLDHEKAQLMYKFLDIKLNVPEIQRAPKPPSQDTAAALLESLSFADMGDAEAAKLGIGWAADGTVVRMTPE